MYKDEKARLQEQIREIQRLSGAAQTNFQGNGIVIWIIIGVNPLLFAESISAWSNQGSVMCLLFILNQ